MTAKKDGDTFKTNRSPKMTEETGFGDKTYKDKDTAKKESKLSFKISDGSKSLKNIVIYDMNGSLEVWAQNPNHGGEKDIEPADLMFEDSRGNDEELVKVLVKVNGKWETLYESIPESKADAIWKAVFAAGENLISIENEAGRRVKEFNKKQMNKKED